MLLSTNSTDARLPSTFAQCSSTHMIFSGGSLTLDGISSGRWPSRRACSAVREARLADRTDRNVASVSTSVPPALASGAIVVQSAIR
jgi:hypothetical protein